MRILVTGGAGFIGSAVSRRLIQTGHEVTIFDSLVTGHHRAVPEAARFVQGDLADLDLLRKTLETGRFEAVLHFAAFIEAGESMRNPGLYFRNNLQHSLALIEACSEAEVRRFVLSSTAAVYASSEEPLSEESPLKPANVYGQTKLMIEQALDWYRQIKGLHYAALRYFNAAGALPEGGEAHQPETHLIPLVLEVALGQRDHIDIYGTDYPTPDGTCIRDYIHLSDLIDAHLLALDRLGDADRLVYNLGNGAGHSVRQVIDISRQITAHAIPAHEAPRRPGDPPRLVASSEKIQSELGWRPLYPSLEDIIGSAWTWHRSHPHGYADT